MNKKIILIQILILASLLTKAIFAQDVCVNVGLKVSLESAVLQENRSVLIHLPNGYKDSNKSYPVLYRLDGSKELMMETLATTNRLTYSEEVAPEMIIVTIENTNRPRDMWPVNALYYPEPNIAGAKAFLSFIETELIPYVEANYRTNQKNVLIGQSLSGIFTSYVFLTKPELFDSFIIISAAFPGCENYFKDITLKAFEQKDKYKGRKVFMTNGLKDPLDPDGTFQQHIVEFSNSISENLNNYIVAKYMTYENEGHVPYHSLYDGLKFVFVSSPGH
ncbi:MAG: hypothetical protein C0599_00425 [Salinivirgaceae bacterium]|nr:MAG: hypothetical protein C0599_00425 [Salinivirgaceae bacterium]